MKFRHIPHAVRDRNDFTPDTAAAYREAVRRFAKKPWVSGVMISIKERDGKLDLATGPVIAIHVRKKLKPRSVKAGRRIPDRILGVPTDVIEINLERSTSIVGIPTPINLPMRPGRSIGRETVGSAGTLGAIVRDSDGKRCLLTARHVIADGASSTKKARLVHPGPADAITPPGALFVAKTTETHLGADAAVARLSPQNLAADNTTAFGMPTVIGAPDDPVLGNIVRKSGRTTGDSRAIIQGWGTGDQGVYPALLLRPVDGTQPAWAAGDSGAVWFDETSNRAIGLHVGKADGQTSEYAVATQLTYIMNALGLTWL